MESHDNDVYEPLWSNYLKRFDLPIEYFSDILTVTEKYCVIVEPRRHPLLLPVIKNFMALLKDSGWGLIVFHGTENEDLIKDFPCTKIKLGVPNLTLFQYNWLMKSAGFWRQLQRLGCKHALTFETDTLLLRGDIDKFLQWDYIGAPWCVKWLGCLEVGNGGLCLRKVDVMLDICLKYNPGNMNHDIYFSLAMLKEGYQVPSIEIASEFSVETIYHPSPCGLHKPHLHKFPVGALVGWLHSRH